MALKTTQWDPSEYLNSPKAIAAFLEAAFEDGDPALIAAALSDIPARGRQGDMANRKSNPKPLTTSEGEVRELTAQDAAEAVPFSALPEAEQSILLKIRRRGSRTRKQKPRD